MAQAEKGVDVGRVRVLRNRHGSAQAAVTLWLAGSLWGNPLQLGPDKFHVYGAHRRGRWMPVDVEFEAQRIVVHRPRRG